MSCRAWAEDSLANTKQNIANTVVTREIKLFQNYFSLHWCSSEISLFQHMETCRR